MYCPSIFIFECFYNFSLGCFTFLSVFYWHIVLLHFIFYLFDFTVISFILDMFNLILLLHSAYTVFMFLTRRGIFKQCWYLFQGPPTLHLGVRFSPNGRAGTACGDGPYFRIMGPISGVLCKDFIIWTNVSHFSFISTSDLSLVCLL